MPDIWGAPIETLDLVDPDSGTPAPIWNRTGPVGDTSYPYKEDAKLGSQTPMKQEDMPASVSIVPKAIQKYGEEVGKAFSVNEGDTPLTKMWQAYSLGPKALGLVNETAGEGFEGLQAQAQGRAAIPGRTMSDIAFDATRAGVAGMQQVATGGRENIFDPTSPTLLKGDTKEEMSRFAKANPTAAGIEAFATPIGRMLEGFVADPAMAGFMKAGEVAARGQQAVQSTKILDTLGALTPDKAAKLLKAVKAGQAATVLERGMGVVFAPDIAAQVVEGANQWWEIGHQKGFDSPDAMGALGGVFAGAGMAVMMGHGTIKGYKEGGYGKLKGAQKTLEGALPAKPGAMTAPPSAQYPTPLAQPTHPGEAAHTDIRDTAINAYNAGYRVTPVEGGFISVRPDKTPIGDERPTRFKSETEAFAAINADSQPKATKMAPPPEGNLNVPLPEGAKNGNVEAALAAQSAPTQPIQAASPSAQPAGPTYKGKAITKMSKPDSKGRVRVYFEDGTSQRVAKGKLEGAGGAEAPAEKMSAPPEEETISLDDLEGVQEMSVPSRKGEISVEEAARAAEDIISSGKGQATERQEVVGGLFYPGEADLPPVRITTDPKFNSIGYSQKGHKLVVGKSFLDTLRQRSSSSEEFNRQLIRAVAHELAHAVANKQQGRAAFDPISGEEAGTINPAGGHDIGGITDSPIADVEHGRITTALDRLMMQHPTLRGRATERTSLRSIDSSMGVEAQKLGEEVWGPGFNRGEGSSASRRKAVTKPGERSVKGEASYEAINIDEMALPPEVQASMKAADAQLKQLNERKAKHMKDGFDPVTAARKAVSDVEFDLPEVYKKKLGDAFVAATERKLSAKKAEPQAASKYIQKLRSENANKDFSISERVDLLKHIDPATLSPEDAFFYRAQATRLRDFLTRREKLGTLTPKLKTNLEILRSFQRGTPGRPRGPQSEILGPDVDKITPPPAAEVQGPKRGPGRPVERTRKGGPGSDREVGVSPRRMEETQKQLEARKNLHRFMGIPDRHTIKGMERGETKAKAIETFLEAQRGHALKIQQRRDALVASWESKGGVPTEGPARRQLEAFENAIRGNEATAAAAQRELDAIRNPRTGKRAIKDTAQLQGQAEPTPEKITAPPEEDLDVQFMDTAPEGEALSKEERARLVSISKDMRVPEKQRNKAVQILQEGMPQAGPTFPEKSIPGLAKPITPPPTGERGPLPEAKGKASLLEEGVTRKAQPKYEYPKPSITDKVKARVKRHLGLDKPAEAPKVEKPKTAFDKSKVLQEVKAEIEAERARRATGREASSKEGIPLGPYGFEVSQVVERIKKQQQEAFRATEKPAPPSEAVTAPADTSKRNILKGVSSRVRALISRSRATSSARAYSLDRALGSIEAGADPKTALQNLHATDRVRALKAMEKPSTFAKLREEVREEVRTAKAAGQGFRTTAKKPFMPPLGPSEGRAEARGGRADITYRDALKQAGKTPSAALHPKGKISVVGKDGKVNGVIDLAKGTLIKRTAKGVETVDLTQRTAPETSMADMLTKGITKGEKERGVKPEDRPGAIRKVGGRVVTGDTMSLGTLQKIILEGGRTVKGRIYFDPSTGEPLRLRMPAPDGNGHVIVVGGMMFDEKGNPYKGTGESFRERPGETTRGSTDRTRARTEDAAMRDLNDFENIQREAESLRTGEESPRGSIMQELAEARGEKPYEPGEAFATEREIRDLLEASGRESGSAEQLEAIKEALTNTLQARFAGQMESSKYDKPDRITAAAKAGRKPATEEGRTGYRGPVALRPEVKVGKERVYTRSLSEAELKEASRNQPSLYELDKEAKGVTSPKAPQISKGSYSEQLAARKIPNVAFGLGKRNTQALNIEGLRTGNLEAQQEYIRAKVQETATPAEKWKNGVSLRDLATTGRQQGLTSTMVEKMAKDLFEIAKKRGLTSEGMRASWVETARREYVKAEKVKGAVTGTKADIDREARSEWLSQRLKEELAKSEEKITPPPKDEGADSDLQEMAVASEPARRPRPAPRPTPRSLGVPEPPIHTPETKFQKVLRWGKSQAVETLREGSNVPRALFSALDLSNAFRQTAIINATVPGRGKRLMNSTLAWGKANHDRIMSHLESLPTYKQADSLGVNFVKEQGEHEAFQGSKAVQRLAEKVGPRTAKAIDRTVTGSERAYTTMQNLAMHDMFVHGKAFLEAHGEWNEARGKDLAKYINDAGSRARIEGGTAKDIATAVLFSPQMLKSRARILKGVGTGFAEYHGAARKYAQRQTAAAIGMGLATLGTVFAAAKAAGKDPKIEYDPRSSDFAKVRIDDITFDPWAGYQQYVRVGAQLWTGQYKKVSSGNVVDKDRLDTAVQFLRSKLAPTPGMMVSVAKRRDIMGREVSSPKGFGRMVVSSSTPGVIQDLAGLAEDPITGAAFAIPLILGMGVSTGVGKGSWSRAEGTKEADVRVTDEIKKLHLNPPRPGSKVTLPGRNAAGNRYYYHLKSNEFENLQNDVMPKVTEALDTYIRSEAYTKLSEAQKVRALSKRIRWANSRFSANKALKKETIDRYMKGEVEPSNEWWKK